MRRYYKQVLVLLFFVFVVAAAFVLTPNISIHTLGIDLERHGMRLGLDLQGGTHLVFQAGVKNPTPQEMEGLVNIIQRRIDAYGVVEPIVQRLGDDRILVQLPGVKDIEEAKALIGKTAQLDFREQKVDDKGVVEKDDKGQPVWIPAMAKGAGGQMKHLTGKFMNPTSAVVLDPTTGLPEVLFEFNEEGAGMFEEITTRLIEKPLGIFLDDQVISAPTVKAIIRSNGVITGITQEEGMVLAIQLNAGALPVPVSIVQEQDVDAILGADSLRKSLIAGIVSVVIIFLFMAVYYRLPGVLAGLALLFYAVFILAIFKLIPVTLTLPGIAGFILSVGMAIDANVLIFERLKEEIWTGRTLGAAVESGFERAWSAIRDSNLTTFISAGVLFWFGDRLGVTMVSGFALILAIGVAVSMFTAILVTHALLLATISMPFARDSNIFLPIGSRKTPSAEAEAARGR